MNEDKINGSSFSWIIKSKLILSCLLIMMSLVLNGCSAVTRSISREIAKSNELSMTQTATARDELVISGDTYSSGRDVWVPEDTRKRMQEQEKLIEAFRIAKEKNRIAMEKKLADCRVAQSQNTRVEPTATPARRVSRDPYESLRELTYTEQQSLLKTREQESTEKSIYTQIPRYDQRLVFTICGVFWDKKYKPQ